MPRSHEQLTDFVATIKKPDYTDVLGIIAAQKENPNRKIVCTFHAGNEDEYTITRIPSRHVRHGMRKEIIELFKDMQRADFVQIIDVSERSDTRMAPKEEAPSDTIFYNKATKTATHVGVSPDLMENIRKVYPKPVRGKRGVIEYKTGEGEGRTIAFTNVWILDVPGPAYKPPKRNLQ